MIATMTAEPVRHSGYPCLTTTPSITLATSSQQSVICSSTSNSSFHLMIRIGSVSRVEEPLHRLLVRAIGFVLEPVDLDGVRLHGLLRRQRLERRCAGRSAECETVCASSRAPGRTVVNAVEPHERGRVIDRVHHGVERRRQRVEILAVERRHERAVQALNRVVRQRVAAVLGVLDQVDLADASGGSVASISSSSLAAARISSAIWLKRSKNCSSRGKKLRLKAKGWVAGRNCSKETVTAM